MKRISSAKIAILAIIAILAGCNTDELCYEHPHVGDFMVRFDWSRCSDAQPRSMAACFWPADGAGESVVYNFSGRDGGKAHLLCGDYLALGLNSDHEDWALVRNSHDIDTYEIYTADAVRLEALGIEVRSLPPGRAGASQRVAMTPGGQLWSHRRDDVQVTADNAMQTVTFYPEEATCHYTVTITDVENIKYLHGAQIDGTITGMAEGFMHGRHAASDAAVTMPFMLTPRPDGNTLAASFLTFGACGGAEQHTVTVYVLFDDGSARYYAFDVTDQVAHAPDPHHVDILIKGLSLPKPIVNGGGFKPSVNGWIDESEEIAM